MGERGVADDGDGREQAGVGRTLGHGNRGSHVDTTVDGLERRQGPQGVTPDVAKHFGTGHFGYDFLYGGINVAVSAPLAQGGRAWHDHLRGSIRDGVCHAQGSCHIVGSQFPGAGQEPCQSARDGTAGRQNPAQLFFDKRLSVFDDDNLVALFGHVAEQSFGKGILGNFQAGERAPFGKTFVHIVPADTASHDAPGRGLARREVAIVGRCLGKLFEKRLLVDQLGISPACIYRQ